MSVEVDHLVVAAASLEQGAAWCEATLGVTPGPGGQHALMSTHNRLLRVARSPQYSRTYLEIIAIDPDAPDPGRARWFGLDDPALQAALARQPQLLHWAAGTRNLDMHRWGLVASGHNPGTTLHAQRDTPAGRLQWRIVVRDDGRLLCDGALPTLIEWAGPHPVDTLPDSGLQLQQLIVRGLPAQAAAVLQPQGVQREAGAGPVLEALFSTPRGPVWLRSPGVTP